MMLLSSSRLSWETSPILFWAEFRSVPFSFRSLLRRVHRRVWWRRFCNNNGRKLWSSYYLLYL